METEVIVFLGIIGALALSAIAVFIEAWWEQRKRKKGGNKDG